jgi:choline dehydrogenase
MWPFSTSYPISTPASVDERKFDYIVVGAGTGGCALAARLSANPYTTVLLLERGDLLTSWVSRVPLLTTNVQALKAPSYKWLSQPSALLGGRIEAMGSGKAFGGTSRVNMGVYQRSVPAEYNAWNEPEWTWEKLEPVFNRAENSLTHGHLPHRGSHGQFGVGTLRSMADLLAQAPGKPDVRISISRVRTSTSLTPSLVMP